jgi:hypothetical protein
MRDAPRQLKLPVVEHRKPDDSVRLELRDDPCATGSPHELNIP